MFRALRRSSSGAPTVFAVSDLHTRVVTARSQVWVGTAFPLRLDYGRSPHAYVNQRLQIQLEFLMMSDVTLETCWVFNEQAGERPQAAHLLKSWVRIPPGAWIFVSCECRVLSGRGLCDELVTRPEESYRLCCVVVCDLETSRMGAPYIYMTLVA